jgi:lipopolysaccharide export LptBFGC system permease protein LptF
VNGKLLHLLFIINLTLLLMLLAQLTQSLVIHLILDVVLLVWLPLIALGLFRR